VGYDISPLKTSRQASGKILNLTLESGEISYPTLKENLFLPLFDTNFILKSFGGPLITDFTTCGERHETF